MIKVSLRSLLLGSAVSVGLVAAAGTANAIQYNFGDVTLQLDTTISAGASVRTAPRNWTLVSSGNGGPYMTGAAAAASGITSQVLPTSSDATAAYTIGLPADKTQQYYAGSINADDSRLNFDRWDMTSAVTKMTNDISANFQNYKFFARVNSYYDAVLSRDSSYSRSALVDGEADAARDIRLLDFYGSADYDVAGLPLNLRAGKQVISWGEGTFLLNGINSVNPIDVGAFRRPGAEIKEGLVPVWALDGSIGLPYNLSVEAFYQLKWEPYQLDRAGTPFASSDVATTGSGAFGNTGGVSFLQGGTTAGATIHSNCDSLANGGIVAGALNGAYSAAAGSSNYAAYMSCGGINPYANFSTPYPIGQSEHWQILTGSGGVVDRDNDRYARNSGQWGVAGRWYSEDLNNTEFGVYFMNYHSRLPIASERVTSKGPANQNFGSSAFVGQFTNGANRFAPYAGCNLTSGQVAALGADPSQANAILGAAGNANPTATFGNFYALNSQSIAALNQVGVDDLGTLAAARQLAVDYYSGVGNNTVVGSPVGSAYAGGTNSTDNPGLALLGGGVYLGDGSLKNTAINKNSMLEAMVINCALVAMQSSAATPATVLDPSLPPSATNPPLHQLMDGAQGIAPNAIDGSRSLGLYLEYPEDIRMIGASFNTTIGTWGVQGEASYRPNAPFQLDTDQITIAGLDQQCILQALLGANYGSLASSNNTYGNSCGAGGIGAGSTDLSGVVRSKMWTAQVGTTATYSNSNALVNGLGADLGILVTEVGLVYVPDVPGADAATSVKRWANVCTSGTDLPLGGALGLSSRSGCRADAASWGYVLLGQLQYNNALGSAVTLSPTVAFSHDVSGNTPSPYGNYRQGRKSVSLQLNGSYQGAWRGGVSYTNFFGSDKYSDAVDRDFAAVNISYAF